MSDKIEKIINELIDAKVVFVLAIMNPEDGDRIQSVRAGDGPVCLGMCDYIKDMILQGVRAEKEKEL